MIDLVCWDFGDTLVDERFMRIPPEGTPGWSAAYDAAFHAEDDFAMRLDLGRAHLDDLIPSIAALLPDLPRPTIARHLRSVWNQVVHFPEPSCWIDRLDGRVLQAIVTVNPHEFHGIAVACGLSERVDLIVTSAGVRSLSKVVMADRARDLLGLEPGLETTLLVDNKADNVDEFAAAGGIGILFERATIDEELTAQGLV